MILQNEKVAALEKLVSCHETAIGNQTEKLKEHDTLFGEISKLPKDQGKIEFLTCNDNAILKKSKREKLVTVQNSVHAPQFILQQPMGDRKSLYCTNTNIEDKDTPKTLVKCTKRKLQDYKSGPSSAKCKRTRSNNIEDTDLSILKCGALAAIANKKK